MRKSLLAVLLLSATACATVQTAEAPPAPAPSAPSHSEYDLAAQRAKIARIRMDPDTDFLSAEERQVVNLLIQAADLMNPIYLRQRNVDNPEVRAAIASSSHAQRTLLLDMFDLHFG